MSDKLPDTGDVVFHRPSGECWVVACVERNRLSWVGWPEGWADLKDCELVESASDESRIELLKQMAAIEGDDHRKRYAQLRLGTDSNLRNKENTQ